MRVTEFLRSIKAEGWTSTLRPGGHYELLHPKATTPVTCPASPSDHRWHKNVRRDMRKVMETDDEPLAQPGAAQAGPKKKRKHKARRDKPLLLDIKPRQYHPTPVTVRPEPLPYDPQPHRSHQLSGSPFTGFTTSRW